MAVSKASRLFHPMDQNALFEYSVGLDYESGYRRDLGNNEQVRDALMQSGTWLPIILLAT
jgi:hypothetical protein